MEAEDAATDLDSNESKAKENGLKEMASDEEEDDLAVDPFQHKLELTTSQWIQTILLGMILVPIRLILIVFFMVLLWIISSVSLRVVAKAEKVKTKTPRPPGRRRRMGLRLIAFIGRLFFRAIGCHVVPKGDLASPKEAPILVFAPHTTFFDVLVWCWCCTFTLESSFISPPYVVSRAENKKIPLFGNIFELVRSLDVDRTNPNSRKDTVDEIIRRSEPVPDANPRARWPQLILSPEGTTTNGKALVYFKPGAFYPGKPIQPILVRYPNKINTITWTWGQPHGAFTTLLVTLAQPYTRVELEFLSIYHPNADEAQDAKLFGKNLRQHMANALKVPTSDLTFAEAKEKYAKKLKRMESMKKDKNC